MSKYLCIDCFKDSGIRKYIDNNGIQSRCAFCGKENIKCKQMKEIGAYMYERITAVYPKCDIDSGYRTQSLSQILLEGYEVYSYDNDYVITYDDGTYDDSGWQKFKELTVEIFSEYDEKINVNERVYRKFTKYEDEYYLHSLWSKFVDNVRYSYRFIPASNEYLFQALDKFITYFSKEIDNVSMYRARLNVEKVSKGDWINQLGPAPADSSKENRLSPRGISYMYLAETINTALAECRAAVGDSAIIGKFIPKRKLHMLNLSDHKMYHSIFELDFDEEYDYYCSFLNMIVSEISKPIRVESDLEYIPSQVFAEYVRAKGLDGIVYNSSLTGEKNYVLFFGADEKKIFFSKTIPCFKDVVSLEDYGYYVIKPFEVKYNYEKSLPGFRKYYF